MSLFASGMAKAVSEAAKAADYPHFAKVMDRYGYDWEAFKVHTEDQYILTTFHVLGKTGQARNAVSRDSVLVQHGNG